MATAVVNTAQLKCESGDAPAPLTVTSQQTVKIGNQLAATINDFAPVTNIPSFGTCKILTSAASGTPTPCVPATVTPWAAGATSPVAIGMPLGLLDSDRLVCTVAASPCISVSDAGQTDTSDT